MHWAGRVDLAVVGGGAPAFAPRVGSPYDAPSAPHGAEGGGSVDYFAHQRQDLRGQKGS